MIDLRGLNFWFGSSAVRFGGRVQVQERVLYCVLCGWLMALEMLFDSAATSPSVHPSIHS
jgi:hypothetical protein